MNIVTLRIKADLGLRDATRLPTLISGVWHAHLWNALHNSLMRCAHAAMMDNHLEAREDMIVIEPGQKPCIWRQGGFEFRFLFGFKRVATQDDYRKQLEPCYGLCGPTEKA